MKFEFHSIESAPESVKPDLEAAQKIITAHLRFVVYIAKSYTGYGLPLEDLVQEGNTGLMKSVKRFDLSYGVRLATFAVYWIKAQIHDYIIRNWRLVKVATTKAQRKLFFNLRSLKQKLSWLNQDEASDIAKVLNVDVSDVFDMESRLQQNDCFFDSSFEDDGEEDYDHHKAKPCYLEDHCHNPEQIVAEHNLQSYCSQQLQQALHQLDERSRDIISSRWLASKKLGLKALAKRYGISMERVRQIEKRALIKIRERLSTVETYSHE